MTGPRVLGMLLAGLGVAAAIFPDWFGPLTGAPSTDVFESVERRVRGGMVLSAGLILIAVPSFRPWSTSIPSAVFYFMTGALAARVLGLIVDGTTPKQWLLVAVEALAMTLAAAWLWRAGAAAS